MLKPVEQMKLGEYVKRKVGAKPTFTRGAYCASTKRYALVDVDDANRIVFVKKGVNLHVGFTY